MEQISYFQQNVHLLKFLLLRLFVDCFPLGANNRLTGFFFAYCYFSKNEYETSEKNTEQCFLTEMKFTLTLEHIDRRLPGARQLVFPNSIHFACKTVSCDSFICVCIGMSIILFHLYFAEYLRRGVFSTFQQVSTVFKQTII